MCTPPRSICMLHPLHYKCQMLVTSKMSQHAVHEFLGAVHSQHLFPSAFLLVHNSNNPKPTHAGGTRSSIQQLLLLTPCSRAPQETLQPASLAARCLVLHLLSVGLALAALSLWHASQGRVDMHAATSPGGLPAGRTGDLATHGGDGVERTG